MNKNNM